MSKIAGSCKVLVQAIPIAEIDNHAMVFLGEIFKPSLIAKSGLWSYPYF
jgi:hypothetical protein